MTLLEITRRIADFFKATEEGVKAMHFVKDPEVKVKAGMKAEAKVEAEVEAGMKAEAKVEAEVDREHSSYPKGPFLPEKGGFLLAQDPQKGAAREPEGERHQNTPQDRPQDTHHWFKAKAVVQHHYGLSPLDWACALGESFLPGNFHPYELGAGKGKWDQAGQERTERSEAEKVEAAEGKGEADSESKEMEEERAEAEKVEAAEGKGEADSKSKEMEEERSEAEEREEGRGEADSKSKEMGRGKIRSGRREGHEIHLKDFAWLFSHPAYARAPLSRIVGQGWFCGRAYELNSATLDPRWESEGLVDLVQEKRLSSMEMGVHGGQGGQGGQGQEHRDGKVMHILDVGTGSGCLLIELLLRYPMARGWGVDLSTEALEAAKKNGQRHAVSTRATFMQSDGLAYFMDSRGETRGGLASQPMDSRDSSGKGSGDITRMPMEWVLPADSERVDAFFPGNPQDLLFDIIVSNPPYITQNFPLPQEVRDWDPPLALYGGEDGLALYRAWMGAMMAKLAPGGICVLEMGWDQGVALWTLLQEISCDQGFIPQGGVEKDHEGKDRYLWFRKS